MTETVVRVTTLEQWKSVLDVWFEHGHRWLSGYKGYLEDGFKNGGEYLFLDGKITFSNKNYYSDPYIEYSEFMAQQKEDNKMKTYYVTQEQLDLIEEFKSLPAPLVAIMNKKFGIETLYNELPLTEIEWFNYLSGVNQIEFKVKEQLYRLWRIDDDGDSVYMKFGIAGTPTYTNNENSAFTAPLEEIKKWKTPAWQIEEVN